MKTTKQVMWAVDPRSGEGNGLLGLAWFGRLAHNHGFLTATFKTRTKANSAILLWEIKNCFPKAKAVKVSVTIKEIKP